MAKIKRRDPKRERFWRNTVSAWGASGLPVREFCDRRGVTRTAFDYWRKELRRRDDERATAPPTATFMPVAILPAPAVAVEVRWAHARRKFVEAEKTSPREAHEAVARIRQLYAVEHEARGLDAPARTAVRREKSGPQLAAMKDWLDQVAAAALPKSPLGEAVAYVRNQWDALTVYARDGALAIDNNAAERAVKPYAIGRKNWLFFGSDRGGRTLAVLSSFTATCLQFGRNPWTWVEETLTRLPGTPAEQLAVLLPSPAGE